MKTSFPTATGVSGMYLTGYRRELLGSDAELLGSVVVKRNYQISGDQLLPQDDPVGVRVTDELKLPGHATEIQLPQPDESCEGCLSRYEHDIAVYKPKADLIVVDDYLLDHHYHMSVQADGDTNQVWFSRSIVSPPVPPPDIDAEEHIFGWQPRFEGVRLAQGDVSITFPEPPNMSNFDNHFFNGYRRDFAQPGFPLTAFSAADTIAMTRTPVGETATDSLFSFSLGREQVSANLYVFSGSGPDEERYWCVKRPIEFRLDTVVVTPNRDNAYLLWRGVWDLALFPAENYRKLDVIMEEEHHG